MIDIYKQTPTGPQPVGEIEKGCWVNLVAPNTAELEAVRRIIVAPPEFFTDPLDADERARVEIDGDDTLIIVRIPMPISTATFSPV